MSRTQIAVVADYDPAKDTHQATEAALQHAAAALDVRLAVEWIPTEEFESAGSVLQLKFYHGVFLGPNAPYRSQAGALAAVRFARELDWPFFAT